MKPNEPVSTRRKRLWIAAGGALALLVLVAALWRVVGSGGAGPLPLEEVSPRPVAGEDAFLARVRRVQPYELDGTYLLGPEFLDIFDSFRAEYIERGEGLMFRRFGQWARQGYSPEVARLLTDVFAKYIDYLKRLAEPGLFPSGASMGQKYQIILALRREVFGEPIASLLFKDKNERIEFALLLDAIRADPSLSEAEKKQKAQELKDSLDPAARERLFPYDPHQDYRERLGKLEEETADLPPEEQAVRVRELREEMFGPEAADRLEALDRVRAERAAREDVYEQERARIVADPSLSEAERTEQIRLLQEDVLRPEQIRKARALEALEGLSSEEIVRRIRAMEEGETPGPDWDAPEQQGANVGVPEEVLNPPGQ